MASSKSWKKLTPKMIDIEKLPSKTETVYCGDCKRTFEIKAGRVKVCPWCASRNLL